MIEVAFHTQADGKDAYVGVIRWDGSAFTIEPPDRDTLQTVLKLPVIDQVAGILMPAKSNPERWMESLCGYYRTAYLSAGKAMRS